jgi:uncharacterized protein (TIGR02145 family)
MKKKGLLVFHIMAISALSGLCQEKGKLTDSRDNRMYKTIQIGNQTWMAENLAYLPYVSSLSVGSDTDPFYYIYNYEGNSISEAKNTKNYNDYGVLYNWKAAKTACPDNWHLPTDEEWKKLETHLGMSLSEADMYGWRILGHVGKKLKSTSAWEIDRNGTNTSGFNAKPGGYRNGSPKFGLLGSMAFFWSSSADRKLSALSRGLDSNDDGVGRGGDGRRFGQSVRCVKDE